MMYRVTILLFAPKVLMGELHHVDVLDAHELRDMYALQQIKKFHIMYYESIETYVTELEETHHG